MNSKREEKLKDILLRHRPSLVNIWPEVFGSKCIDSKVMFVSGPTASGKSLLAQELAARAVMANEDPDEAPEVLFIDVAGDYKIKTFVRICTKLKAEDRLEKVFVHTCGLNNFRASTLTKILAEYPKISLILLDSLESLNSNDRQASISRKNVRQSEVSSYEHLVKKFNVTFVCIQTSDDLPFVDSDRKLSIAMQKLDSDRFTMKIKAEDIEREVAFEVDASGMNLIE